MNITRIVLGLLCGVTLVACKTGPPKQVGDDDSFARSDSEDVEQPELKPDKSPSKGTSSDTPKTPDPPGMEGLDEDQKAQLEVALRRGASKAAQCPGVVKGAPTGKGEVRVEFDGKKGRSIEATVGSPFAGTEVESCIKRGFIGEIIVPFEGPNRTIAKDIELKPPSAGGAGK